MKLSYRRAGCALAALVAVAGSRAGAQSTDVPVPDTLGASFDADHPGTAALDAFDYLIGEWSFRFQTRKQDGSYNPPRPGTWKTWKSHDGLLVEDEWAVDPPPGAPRRVTLTYRAWNPRRQLWEIVGVVPGEGSFEPGIAWTSGNDRLLVQHYGDFITRIRYYAITADHFLRRADGSDDGGKTWQRDLWKLEANRMK